MATAIRSRIEQRDQLMTSLGMLAQPIRTLIDSVATWNTAPYVEAQFNSDFDKFQNELRAFGHSGRHFFDLEFRTARNACESLRDFTQSCRDPTRDPARVREGFDQRLEHARATIRAIPCDDPGTVLPSDSPYQTYLRLRAICAQVSKRLELFDPYLTADVFHRYLVDLPNAAHLVVLTSDKVMCGSDTVRRDRIVAVSELVARERPQNYRFLVTAQQHDRHCRADDSILHMGGSIAHASFNAPYTLSKLDPSQHAFLDVIIAGATEWFGPMTTIHRRV